VNGWAIFGLALLAFAAGACWGAWVTRRVYLQAAAVSLWEATTNDVDLTCRACDPLIAQAAPSTNFVGCGVCGTVWQRAGAGR